MDTIKFPGQMEFYQGKVRDVYTISGNLLVMIASDRISAFDVILPRTIPYKGQVLNELAAYMLEASRDLCTNWLLEVPAPNASIGIKCNPIKIEMVVRGYLCGHAWRTYEKGQRILCGALLADGLKENDRLPIPVITPSTKAAAGHDEDITPEEIINQGLCSPEQWETISSMALKLFERGSEMASKQNLILADTKYEFGIKDGQIILMDEIHTPDSSRYFYAEGFDKRQEKGEKQKQLSKEFVREWLIQNMFMGKEGQTIPEMTDQWVETISNRYIELYEKLTGQKFKPVTLTQHELTEKINKALEKYQKDASLIEK